MRRKVKFRSKTTLVAILAFGIFFVSCNPQNVKEIKKPNVIIYLVDDQGYNDLGCYGNPYVKTPEMDKLYEESVRFDDFHVDPTCAPTRAALLSGRYSHRAKVWHTVMNKNYLDHEAYTLADAFKATGYTTAQIGKWHIGDNYPYRSIDRGFDVTFGNQGYGFCGHYANDRMDDYYFRQFQHSNWEQKEGFCEDVIVDEAIDFIGKQKETENPYFLYLCTWVPHKDWTIPDTTWAKKFEKAPVSKELSYYYGSLERVDYNFGRLRKYLKETGLEENTLIVFLTDNGTCAVEGAKLFSANMRGTKASEYDGGHRVPCFMHWPGGNLGEPRDIMQLTAHFDIMPTLVDMLDLEVPEGYQFDGTSLKPLLIEENTQWPERTLVVESQRVVKPKKWKQTSVMTERWRYVNGKELYDMDNDPRQQKNVADKYPEVVKDLTNWYDHWWNETTKVDDYNAKPIAGTPHQKTVKLSAMDRIPTVGTFISDYKQLTNPPLADGFWELEFAEDGTYSFDVRRWGKEMNMGINETVEEYKDGDVYMYGKLIPQRGGARQLDVKTVRFELNGKTHSVSIHKITDNAKFNLQCKKGPAKIKASFLDAKGELICGAYVIYVSKIDNTI